MKKEKLFKKETNNIFTKLGQKYYNKQKYNPLYKDEKIYKGDGLIMKKTKETKNVILNELTKELKYKERLMVKLFPNIFIKIFRKGMIYCFNYYNKNGTFLH